MHNKKECGVRRGIEKIKFYWAAPIFTFRLTESQDMCRMSIRV